MSTNRLEMGPSHEDPIGKPIIKEYYNLYLEKRFRMVGNRIIFVITFN